MLGNTECSGVGGLVFQFQFQFHAAHVQQLSMFTPMLSMLNRHPCSHRNPSQSCAHPGGLVLMCDLPMTAPRLCELPIELFEIVWRRLMRDESNKSQHALRCTCKAAMQASNGLISKLRLVVNNNNEGTPENEILEATLLALSSFPSEATLTCLTLRSVIPHAAAPPLSPWFPQLMVSSCSRLRGVRVLRICTNSVGSTIGGGVHITGTHHGLLACRTPCMSLPGTGMSVCASSKYRYVTLTQRRSDHLI